MLLQHVSNGYDFWEKPLTKNIEIIKTLLSGMLIVLRNEVNLEIFGIRQWKSPRSTGQTKCEAWRGSKRPQRGELRLECGINIITEVKMSQFS